MRPIFSLLQIFFIFFADKDYLLHFTSVLPIHLRYMLLNTEPEDGIKLNVWYSKPNRMDVFVDGVYVDPTNARTTDSGRGGGGGGGGGADIQSCIYC